MIAQAAVNNDVKNAVTELFRAEMGAFGFQDVRIEPSEDHDGDAVLLIEANYSANGDPINTTVMVTVMAQLISKLRDLLWGMGEYRFPHIHHNFQEHQQVVGFR